MIYKLLDTGYGVVIDRLPIEVSNDGQIEIAFDNAPINSYVSITSDGNTLIRELNAHTNSSCYVPIKKLGKNIKIRLCKYDDTIVAWECEGLVRINCGDKSVFLPSDIDWRIKLNELALENQLLRDALKTTNSQLAELTKKVESAFEGYDII